MSEQKKEEEKKEEEKKDDAAKGQEQAKKEEEEEDDAIELNPIKAQFKKSRMITFYDPPAQLMKDKLKNKENLENNLLRRWKVEIFNIEITNLTKNTINPFVQFIIGGDYRIEYK